MFQNKDNKIREKEVTAEVIANFPCENESHINITLVQGLLKGEKMDLVIQKATELGVTDIVPVITRRSQLRETRKISRWRKIAEEASRQSGRSVVPVIHEAVEFSDFLSASGSLHGLIFYEEEGMRLSEAVSSFKGTVLDLPQGKKCRGRIRTVSKYSYCYRSGGRVYKRRNRHDERERVDCNFTRKKNPTG